MDRFIKYILLSGLLISIKVYSQVERHFIEKYYISGTGDTATIIDTGSGDTLVKTLEAGSTTYRVFIGLQEGYALKKLYAANNLPFKIESTQPFFNNTDRGESYGFNIRAARLEENTVALDTWLTLGLAANNYLAVPKYLDTDGSILAENLNGMLKNEHPDAGVSLVVSDGLQEDNKTFNIFGSGIVDPVNGNDPTIFGGLVSGNVYESSAMSLTADGEAMAGATPDNLVLVAQLTTKGDISFVMNIVIEDNTGKMFYFSGNDTLLPEGVYYNPWLKYPVDTIWGCMDPWFVQYNPYAMFDDGSCTDSVFYGCPDPVACNYDPNIIFPEFLTTEERDTLIKKLCCYNSSCILDLATTCPETIYGCIDPSAANYNPLANRPDSCSYCFSKGCKNSDYIEYSDTACIHDSAMCKVLIVYGCMADSACNYNPVANKPHKDKPCEFKSCKQKNGTIKDGKPLQLDFDVYPNPAFDIVNLDIVTNIETLITYYIIDAYGRDIRIGKPGFANGQNTFEINITGLEKGLYFIKVVADKSCNVKQFIKN